MIVFFQLKYVNYHKMMNDAQVNLVQQYEMEEVN